MDELTPLITREFLVVVGLDLDPAALSGFMLSPVLTSTFVQLINDLYHGLAVYAQVCLIWGPRLCISNARMASQAWRLYVVTGVFSGGYVGEPIT